MAQNQVTPIGPNQTTPGKKAKKGSGDAGSKVGFAVGTAVGAYYGGGEGAMAGGASGAHVGGMIGNWVDPAKAGTDAITRRLESTGPQITHSPQSETLKQSLLSLKSQPPEVQQQYQAPLVQAYIASLAKDNPKPTGVA